MSNAPEPAPPETESPSIRLARLARRFRAHVRTTRPHLGVIGIAEGLVHYAVAIVLLAVAAIVLWHTAYDLLTSGQSFSDAATTAVNGVLFAIIVLEVMRTVIAHFETSGLQLQPFLVIGIISAVREILTVGARLSLKGARAEPTTRVVHTALLELGVNAAVVVGLALALVLVRKFAGMIE